MSFDPRTLPRWGAFALLLLAAGLLVALLRSRGPRLSAARRAEERAGYLLASPWLLGLVILLAGPIVLSLLLSLTRWNGLGTLATADFVGLANYPRIFTEDTTFRCGLDFGFREVVDSNLHGLVACSKVFVQFVEKDAHAAILLILGLRKVSEERWDVHTFHVMGSSVRIAPVYSLIERHSYPGIDADSIGAVLILDVACMIRSGALAARRLGRLRRRRAHSRNNVRHEGFE